MKLSGFLFLTLVSIAGAQSDGSALAALKLIPKDAAKRLARIEAREGTPVPERWYLIAYDPAVPRGVREFVVSEGRLAANRTLSQFADELKPADVIGAESVRFDSGEVARLVERFTAANGVRMGSVNYELTKATAAGPAEWRATVLDPNGDQIGMLAMAANTGTVLSHEGFDKEPAPEAVASTAPQRRGGSPAGVVAPRAAQSRSAPLPGPKPKVFERIFGASDRKPGEVAR
ncbi:MAG: hypothetical protein ABMA01_16490 [Chthoniobacteraceae bacterium]